MRRIAGRYLVREPLGRGGMGTVFAATDEVAGREVAIKVLHPELRKDPALVRRFRREAAVLEAIRHRAIVEVLGSGEEGDDSYFVMERIEGPTLRQRLDGGRLRASVVASILGPAADGLAEAHGRGVIHGDLKPENVFVLDDSPVARVKVVDFGSCKVHGLERLTATGETIGTPAYMAPELLTGGGPVDERIDVYALGVILFEALAGALPFPERHPGKLVFAIARGDAPRLDGRYGVDAGVADVVHRAIAREPRDRYADVSALARALADAVARQGNPS